MTSDTSLELVDFVSVLSSEIFVVGTHKVPSIKLAEAAEVIENTERDAKISLINELVVIFNRVNIVIEYVLRAAGTK